MMDFVLCRSKRRDWDVIRVRPSCLAVWLRVAVSAAAVGFLIAATLAVLAVRTAVQQASADEHTATAKVSTDADEAHRLLLEAGLTAREARLAAAEERASLGKWNQTAANINSLLISLQATSDGVRNSQAAIAAQSLNVLTRSDAAIAGLVPLEANANTAITHLDAAVRDPRLNDTLTHLDTTATNVDAMSTDIRAKVHSVLHPKWTTRVLNVFQTVGVDVGKVLF